MYDMEMLQIVSPWTHSYQTYCGLALKALGITVLYILILLEIKFSYEVRFFDVLKDLCSLKIDIMDEKYN
jgi:hypothetical protein